MRTVKALNAGVRQNWLCHKCQSGCICRPHCPGGRAGGRGKKGGQAAREARASQCVMGARKMLCQQGGQARHADRGLVVQGWARHAWDWAGRAHPSGCLGWRGKCTVNKTSKQAGQKEWMRPRSGTGNARQARAHCCRKGGGGAGKVLVVVGWGPNAGRQQKRHGQVVGWAREGAPHVLPRRCHQKRIGVSQRASYCCCSGSSAVRQLAELAAWAGACCLCRQGGTCGAPASIPAPPASRAVYVRVHGSAASVAARAATAAAGAGAVEGAAAGAATGA